MRFLLLLLPSDNFFSSQKNKSIFECIQFCLFFVGRGKKTFWSYSNILQLLTDKCRISDFYRKSGRIHFHSFTFFQFNWNVCARTTTIFRNEAKAITCLFITLSRNSKVHSCNENFDLEALKPFSLF